MTPITRREDAKEGGFAQVREVLLKFEGDVTGFTFDQWGGQLVDDEGRRRQPREFFEISFTNVEVLESTEALAMDISEQWSVRINCSDFKNSFWVEMFLASADAHKILIPDGISNKRLTMEKQTLEATDPKFNKTDWVIVGVKEIQGEVKASPTPVTETAKEEAPTPVQGDVMAIVEGLALGKTEAELAAAIPECSELKGHPMLPLAKAGMITQALLNENRLVLVEGKYQKAG